MPDKYLTWHPHAIYYFKLFAKKENKQKAGAQRSSFFQEKY